MISRPSRALWIVLLLFVGAFGGLTASASAKEGSTVHVVNIPTADRFTPFVVTIHQGDVVRWVNGDTDDHTVVSDDPFTTAGHEGTNHLIAGTDSNAGEPGNYSLRFSRPGIFTYYCRFHAVLDGSNQPTAPGPKGGIQDANGNYGTPMSGVIVVLN
jgi:plastocyanin